MSFPPLSRIMNLKFTFFNFAMHTEAGFL
jgi:hypothetical protein